MEIVLALVPPHVSRYTSNIFKSHFSLPPIGGCYGSDHSKDLFAPPTIVWMESLTVVGPRGLCLYVCDPRSRGGNVATWLPTWAKTIFSADHQADKTLSISTPPGCQKRSPSPAAPGPLKKDLLAGLQSRRCHPAIYRGVSSPLPFPSV